MDDSLTYPQLNAEFNIALATSLVLIGFDGTSLQLLLAKASKPPFEGGFFLPSRYLPASEDSMSAAQTMFEQMFGYDDPEVIEQLKAFDSIHRHPDGRVVNIAHYALVNMEDFQKQRWAKHDLKWFPFARVPELVFDHNEIVQYAKERLKRRFKRRPVGFNLLSEEFTLSQLQKLYEEALGKKFDRRNFRKKLAKTDVIVKLGKESDGSAKGQRAGSNLWAFNKERYREQRTKGYDFLF